MYLFAYLQKVGFKGYFLNPLFFIFRVFTVNETCHFNI